MKKKNVLVTLGLSLAVGLGVAAGYVALAENAIESKAEVVSTGYTGGEYFYVVDEIGAFANTSDGDGQLRAYFLNSDDSKDLLGDCVYTVVTQKNSKPVYRVVVPNYIGTDGGSWSKMILLRYKIANVDDTAVNWSHVNNQSDDIDVTSFKKDYNTFYVWGWRDQTNKFEASWGQIDDYKGAVSGSKMYAETAGWDQAGRKGLFGIHFFNALEDNILPVNIVLSESLKVKGTSYGVDFSDFSSGLWEFTVPTDSSGKAVTWRSYNFVELKKDSFDSDSDDGLYWSSNLSFGDHNVVKGGNAADYDVGTVQRAKYFSAYLLSQTDTICDEDGNTNPSSLSTAWSNIEAQFPIVNGAALEFTNAVANENSTDESKMLLEKAAARYDYIIGKYNTSSAETYSDFANRVIAGKITLGERSHFQPMIIDTNSSTAIVLAVSVAATTAMAGFFFLRRRKEQ